MSGRFVPRLSSSSSRVYAFYLPLPLSSVPSISWRWQSNYAKWNCTRKDFFLKILKSQRLSTNAVKLWLYLMSVSWKFTASWLLLVRFVKYDSRIVVDYAKSWQFHANIWVHSIKLDNLISTTFINIRYFLEICWKIYITDNNEITFFMIVKSLREHTQSSKRNLFIHQTGWNYRFRRKHRCSRGSEAISVCRVSNDVTLRTLGAHHVNQVNVVPTMKAFAGSLVAGEIRFSSPPCRTHKIRSTTPYSRWLRWRHYLTSSFCRQHSEQESYYGQGKKHERIERSPLGIS